MTSLFHSVITTIQQPTRSMEGLLAMLARTRSSLLVVGDRKGPKSYDVEGAEFFSLQRQLESQFKLASNLPLGHYSRKNIGYLAAISRGASGIYETDDDNAPLDSWQPRQEMTTARDIRFGGWVNVFRLFTSERIWPRGFPLDEVAETNSNDVTSSELSDFRAPIQQGLANNSPDVDAIWRLVINGPFVFEPGPSVRLAPGSWCPFNSQSTWWFPIAYPLMYLPSFCSFRMTDIWRSFVAQRCLWELDMGVVFHAAEVIQERNEHDLMRDFKDEIVGYTRNKEFAKTLETLTLGSNEGDIGQNLLMCYDALVSAGFFSPDEMVLVNAWLEDIKAAKC
jgi:hypothetical protein